MLTEWYSVVAMTQAAMFHLDTLYQVQRLESSQILSPVPQRSVKIRVPLMPETAAVTGD